MKQITAKNLLNLIRRHKIITGLAVLFFLFLLVPVIHFNVPYSTVVEAADGSLLGAKLAADGQWRFPVQDTLPEKFKRCIIRFEDRKFYFHPGINPIAIVRAIGQNIRARKIISGASTLSMQVVRLSRTGERRTFWEKFLEMILTFRLESVWSKDEILALYAAHAPFGGNVVGLEAAAWRYFGCSADQLSWGESAGLAVLPNAPSQIFPGKNTEQFKRKRDRLLRHLLTDHTIDSVTYELAVSEPLPGKPEPLPDLAHHLLNKCSSPANQTIVKTTINRVLQLSAQRIIDQQLPQLKGNHIYNAACLVAEVKTGKIIAYIGNADWTDPHGGAVDVIDARRSTGSILKPFLFAAMLDAGKMMPDALVPDLPLYFSGYAPQNYDLQFRGAVPASEALIRSLNVPAVFMLKNYTPVRFLDILKRVGLTTFNKDAGYYGLSLILGGGEATLMELVSAYGSMARVLNRFTRSGKYDSGDYHLVNFLSSVPESKLSDGKFVFRAASIWQTLNTLTELNRPVEEAGWQQLSSSGRLAWKTGTSYGFRDAWAIGVNPEYVIGVWVGNASGEGRPGLTGGQAAAPILFELSSLLGSGSWFEKPLSGMMPVEVCLKSGYRASVNCNETDTVMVPESCLNSPACPYHQKVHLDTHRQYLVNAECYPQDQIVNENWFILPPAMEYYYLKYHPAYRTLPPWLPGSIQANDIPMVELIYPDDRLMVYLPRNNAGQKGQVIFQAAHRRTDATIFWHLDNVFLGSTRGMHQMTASPAPGNHKLVIVDELGNSSSRYFKVVK
ncbi:MAG TPA: penicillin-binding protein 1C [Prolixibacteraceae bacterium]|nr:penicillin-binding protein 1C [Prolixibacteraceae bacterium]